MFLEIVPYILHGLYIYTNSHEHPSVPCEEFSNAPHTGPVCIYVSVLLSPVSVTMNMNMEGRESHSAFQGFLFLFSFLFFFLGLMHGLGARSLFYIFLTVRNVDFVKTGRLGFGPIFWIP